MNRLILIGNGFDLAHGMKTSYNDFILWYLNKCYEKAFEDENYNGDYLIEINKSNYYHHWNSNSKKEYFEFVNHYFKKDVYELFSEDKLSLNNNTFRYNPFQTKVKSKLLNQLLLKCASSNWVDIENEFYEQLKAIFKVPINYEGEINLSYREGYLNTLNNSLKVLIQELEMYLLSIISPELIESYNHIFKSIIRKDDIVIGCKLEKDEEAHETLILNFNYTPTPEKYLKNEPLDFSINYIHGKINDPNNQLIFGFGDELDSDYNKLELQKLNRFFQYIKSFWYFKTSNYHNLVRFIDEEFQAYILGHSCGLSDRTMLNMIFEHENCKSIKIFYHGTKEKNNYTDLTQEISRHFKDKGMMRKKIVPFDKSEPMPQVE